MWAIEPPRQGGQSQCSSECSCTSRILLCCPNTDWILLRQQHREWLSNPFLTEAMKPKFYFVLAWAAAVLAVLGARHLAMLAQRCLPNLAGNQSEHSALGLSIRFPQNRLPIEARARFQVFRSKTKGFSQHHQQKQICRKGQWSASCSILACENHVNILNRQIDCSPGKRMVVRSVAAIPRCVLRRHCVKCLWR